MKKTVLLFSAMLAAGVLSAAPAQVQIHLWESILRYQNSNLTLNFPYKDAVGVGFEQQGNFFGGFRLALSEWKGDEQIATKVEENGRTLQISWPGVAGAAMQVELGDDNIIAAAFTKPASVQQKLFFHCDLEKLQKNGKCAIIVDGQAIPAKYQRGGIKSITFYAGDAAKTFTFNFGNNCAAIVTVGDKFADLTVFPFNSDTPAEFTIVPGQE